MVFFYENFDVRNVFIFLLAEWKWHRWSCCRSWRIRMTITAFIRRRALPSMPSSLRCWRDPDIPAVINWITSIKMAAVMTVHRNREFISPRSLPSPTPSPMSSDLPWLSRQQSQPSRRVIFNFVSLFFSLINCGKFELDYKSWWPSMDYIEVSTSTKFSTTSFFVMGCTPKPFPFSVCAGRRSGDSNDPADGHPAWLSNITANFK